MCRWVLPSVSPTEAQLVTHTFLHFASPLHPAVSEEDICGVTANGFPLLLVSCVLLFEITYP